MAESKLDIIIDPRRAQEGARMVVQSLQRVGNKAVEVTTTLNRRFTEVKNSILSMNSALGALGVGLFAKSLIDVTRQLNLAERGMRTVTTSTGQAAIQLERVRKIADEFMMGDLPMANAFRLLASHDIPNAERALRILGNVALSTGEDIETVTTAVLSGQERTLRRLGVRLVDLGQGQVDLIFGNMEIRAQKTDQAIRAGLLQLFEKGLPDATKEMGRDLDFQMKRMEDAWEDFKIAVMRGGLEDFITATFKRLNDGFDEEGIKQKGQRVAKVIQDVVKTIALNIAFVIDLIRPVGTLFVDIIGRAFATFNKLPTPIQTVGIFGAIFFGLRGFAVLTAGLALADKLNEIADTAGKGGGKLAETLKNIGFGAEGEQKTILALDELTKSESASALATTKKFFADVDAEAAKSAKNRAAMQQKANAERAGGASGIKGGGVSDEQRILTAQLEKLRRDTDVFVQMESDKRDRMFNPEKAAALAKAIEYINGLREKGLTIGEKESKIIAEQFIRQADAVTQTRVWTMLEQGRLDVLEAIDDAKAMEISLEQRDLTVARLKLSRDLMFSGLKLTQEQRDELFRNLEVIDEQNKKLRERQALEEEHLSIMKEASGIRDRTRDTLEGLDAPSKRTRVNDKIRELEVKKRAPLSDEARQKLVADMDDLFNAERADAIAKANDEIQRETENLGLLHKVTGMTKDAREAELRVTEKWLALKRQGIELMPDEIDQMREQSKVLQEGIQQQRVDDAINGFVDSFHVGWEEIVKSGEQAYSHLEDALTQWIMKGKLDFTSFANFITQELIRMGIRASMSQLMGMGGGASGMIGSFIQMGIGAMASGGSGVGAQGAAVAAQRGAMNPNLYGPGFQQGGVFDYSGGRFRSYYDVPGAQRGMVSTHERLLRISEGHTPEAVIPLRGGKVPVQMQGGRSVSFSAPITIITPDASGIRRSDTQIQAQMSSALVRASRRIL